MRTTRPPLGPLLPEKYATSSPAMHQTTRHIRAAARRFCLALRWQRVPHPRRFRVTERQQGTEQGPRWAEPARRGVLRVRPLETFASVGAGSGAGICICIGVGRLREERSRVRDVRC